MSRATADAEWRRLAETTSLTALLADHVSDVAAVAIEDVPWLATLAVPDGWHGAITPITACGSPSTATDPTAAGKHPTPSACSPSPAR